MRKLKNIKQAVGTKIPKKLRMELSAKLAIILLNITYEYHIITF